MHLLEKTMTDDGAYQIKFDGRILFEATDNETIRWLGEHISELSDADDCATMVLG